MKRRYGVAAAGLLSFGLVLGGAAAANAAVSVGGGEWDYGTDWNTVYSKYNHFSKSHSATACNGMGICAYSEKRPSVWANAVIGKVPFSGNTSAYWNAWW